MLAFLLALALAHPAAQRIAQRVEAARRARVVWEQLQRGTRHDQLLAKRFRYDADRNAYNLPEPAMGECDIPLDEAWVLAIGLGLIKDETF